MTLALGAVKQGSAVVIVDSDGVALGSSTNPIRNDPTGTTVQPVSFSGSIVLTAGTAVAINDGVNPAIIGTVKAASTAALATDLSQVVALNPNTPLPSGTNALGSVTLGAGSAVVGHVINDASSAVIGHVIVDSGTLGSVTIASQPIGVSGSSLTTALQGSVPSGANAIGSVTIGSGANVIGHVIVDSGTLGSVTIASQPIAVSGASLTAALQGPVPSGTNTIGSVTIGASSAVIGHVINDASSAVIGHVIVDSGTLGSVTIASQPIGVSGASLTTALQGAVPSGTNTIGNITLVPATSGGLSTAQGSIKTASTTVKASAGQVYGWYVYNGNAATSYLQFFNAASANVTAGTTVPFMSIGLGASAAANVFTEQGIAFSTAITIAATTGVSTSGAPANNVDYNVFYK